MTTIQPTQAPSETFSMVRNLRTPAQRERQAEQHRENGRYSKVNPCYVCTKSAGIDYYSHPDTDGLINDELLVLCKKCADRLCNLPGKEAIKAAFPEVQR